jgi:hypothetical protein
MTAAPSTTTEAIALIEAALGPGDVFGSDAARAYRRLAQLTHPDTHPGDSRAASAFAKLADLWQRYQVGHGALVARGDIANLYRVSQGLLKVTRDPADNDLMRAETVAAPAGRGRRGAPGRADPRRRPARASCSPSSTSCLSDSTALARSAPSAGCTPRR